MQVSGLVLYLEADAESSEAAVLALGRETGLELGERQGADRLPAVLEATSPEHSHAAVRRLERLPGIQRVEVAFVSLGTIEKESK